MDTMETESHQHLRPMKSSLSLLSKPDGSSNLSQGNTCVMVSVYGPGEVRMQREIIDKATVEVLYKPKSGQPACAEKLQERLIRNTCETVILTALHPRSSISLTLQELQNCGSILATSINASCLALLDACVPMRYLVAAVCVVIDEDGQIILDPTEKQERTATSAATFAFDSKDYGVITISTQGQFTTDLFQTCLLACREASRTVVQFYRDTMQRKLSKA